MVIADGRIAGVGCYSWRASQTISASGLVILPGLIDAHMHLESTLLTPAELARLIVPMGTTAVISDSHEVGNVMGVRGIDMLAAACEGLAAGPVLHGVVVRARDGVGRRRRIARARARSRRSCRGPASWAWPR